LSRFDYDEAGYQSTRLGKVNILLNGKKVDSLSFLCHRSKTEAFGRGLVSKLKSLVEKQLYSVAIQAVVGSKVVAREE
jgi:translation elongation factor EF-4